MRCDTAPGVRAESAGRTDLPPLIVVHGSMDRSAGLLRLSRRLDTRFRVVRYDRRGYGRSRSVGPPWTVAANVADLDAVVAATSGTFDAPVALFGHSFGGNVALQLALRRPDRFKAVIPVEAADHAPGFFLDWWRHPHANAAQVCASGVFWPTSDDPLFELINDDTAASSDHRLVWLDVSATPHCTRKAMPTGQ